MVSNARSDCNPPGQHRGRLIVGGTHLRVPDRLTGSLKHNSAANRNPFLIASERDSSFNLTFSGLCCSGGNRKDLMSEGTVRWF